MEERGESVRVSCKGAVVVVVMMVVVFMEVLRAIVVMKVKTIKFRIRETREHIDAG